MNTSSTLAIETGELPYPPRSWETRGYRFDLAAAAKACAFFPRYLRHTKGRFAGRPFELEEWQRKLISAIFGWRRADGTRVYRIVYLEIPRKNGKTTLAAGIALYLTMADGELGAEVYSAANDKDQAAICFNEAKKMRAMSEALRNRSLAYKTSIVMPTTGSAYKVLSSDAGTKDGLNASGVVYDEVHALRDRDLYDVLHTSTGARTQPLEVLITTAGVDRNSLCWQMHEHAEKVAEGIIDDPEFLGVIFAASADDDWTKPETWYKANPSLGNTVGIDYIAKEAERAKLMPASENVFKRLHLNIWTEQVTRWLPIDKWDLGADPIDADSLRGRRCYAGLDLARVRDLSAFVLLFPPVDAGEKWKVLCRFWVPEEDIRQRSKRDRVPYELWREQGFIEATPGNTTDFAWIEAGILEWAKLYDIVELAYDRTFAGEIVQHLMAEGMSLVEFGQGHLSMAAPTAEVERLVLGEEIQHGGHPVARWCVRNVSVRIDPAGNMKPDKEKSTERIDFVSALCNAVGRALVRDEQGARSYYEDHGL